MGIMLELLNVTCEERSTGTVLGDVAAFRYAISGAGVDTGTIEIVVPWTTPDLGAAQKKAEQKLASFAAALAKAMPSPVS